MLTYPDTAVVNALEPYEDIASAKLRAVVGYTDVLLDNDDFKCRLQECNIGNLIADAYVDYVRYIKCLLFYSVQLFVQLTAFYMQSTILLLI